MSFYKEGRFMLLRNCRIASHYQVAEDWDDDDYIISMNTIIILIQLLLENGTSTRTNLSIQMNTNNNIDLKVAKRLLDYVIFECTHLKTLPSGQFYPGETPRSLNKPPLALILRIITNEICIVLVEKKKEISIPLEQLRRFAINEKRDIELEMKRKFRKFFYEYPLGEIDFRIQIAIDPLGGLLDDTTTIVFSPCDYVEDKRYLKLSNEMKRLRFNKENPKKQIPQLNDQEKSDKLQHNESSDMNQVSTCQHIQSFNDHKRSFNQEPQYNCKNLNITGDGVKSFEKDYPSKFVVTAQNVEKPNVTKGEPVHFRNKSIAEWISKTNNENIMDSPMTPPTIKSREEATIQLEKQVNNLFITSVANGEPNHSLLDMDDREIMNLTRNIKDPISVSKLINRHEALSDKRYENENSNTSFITEAQLYITFAFLIQNYVIVIPYETSLKDLINTIEQRYNVKVDHSNLYFKNAVNDRINIVDEEDWLVARFEAKEIMNNKIILYFS
ncbi:hypothetical protein RhiirC2_854799 [Rhizophagus irregularis]|uniref:PB1 domain-containing protein n=1 Tax=Rhizophagus irregularis TaxID=588596 RepID=A0A2N1MQ72_9GLOM|nr:hypothetical protein RhiirC2_854799 [Rhizophagus irregularis]